MERPTRDQLAQMIKETIACCKPKGGQGQTIHIATLNVHITVPRKACRPDCSCNTLPPQSGVPQAANE